MPNDTVDPGATERRTVVASPRAPLRSASIGILALIAVVLGLKFAKDALIPITLAVFLGYALMPMVMWLKKRARIPLPIGAALALSLAVGGTGAGVLAVQPQVNQLIDSVPQATQKLKALLHRTSLDRNSAVRRLTIAADEIQKATAPVPGSKAGTKAAPAPAESPLKLRDYVWSGALQVFNGLGQTVIILALSFFLLISGHDFKRKLVRISGQTLRQKKLTVQILEEIEAQIQRYLLIQFGTSALVGVATGIVFAVIGLENAMFWGFAAGAFHLIPYIGTALVIGAAAVFAYLQFDDPHVVLVVVASAFAVAGVIGLGLVPWLTQRMARMNAVATFMSLIVWNWLWGVPGLLLGIPIMMVVMAICERIEHLSPIGELLASEAPRPTIVTPPPPAPCAADPDRCLTSSGG